MMEILSKFSLYLENVTGISGILGYVAIFIFTILANSWIRGSSNKSVPQSAGTTAVVEEEPEPPRNFTLDQLRNFDGTHDSTLDDQKPIYLSVGGTVFDVSSGRDFYGPPDGPYSMFAGRECGVALARMSFEEKDLGNVKECEKLNFGEKQELEGWYEKFRYFKGYPIVGKVLADEDLASEDRVISREELAKCDGTEEVPEGYATPPIYMAVKGKVYDVSFGGTTFYGPGSGYSRFAGKDASRALAKMSFDPVDTENPDISNLTEKEMKTLDDWIHTFEVRKKYPVVGRLEKVTVEDKKKKLAAKTADGKDDKDDKNSEAVVGDKSTK